MNNTNYVPNGAELPLDLLSYFLCKKISGSGGITREEVLQIVNEAIAKLDNLSRKIVNSIEDMDVESDDADKYIYMVLRDETEENNIYDEYMVIDKKIELVGNTKIDLSNYVQKTDYANASSGGVVKTSDSYSTTITANGALLGTVKSSIGYSSGSNQMFISKGTLENVKDSIVKQGLLDNTQSDLTNEEKTSLQTWLNTPDNSVLSDYITKNIKDKATSTKMGTIRVSTSHGLMTSEDGYLTGVAIPKETLASNSGSSILCIGSARNCAEEWSFTLEDGTTVTKNIFIVPQKE